MVATWRWVAAAGVLGVLTACGGKTPTPNTDPSAEVSGYSTVLYGQVKAGQGSGVVGVPLDGVEVTLHYGGASVGPVKTDPSGSLTIDALPLFPPGTVDDPQALESAATLNVEVHFQRDGYRPTVEIVTFPVERYREFTFYLKGEGG